MESPVKDANIFATFLDFTKECGLNEYIDLDRIAEVTAKVLHERQ